MFGIIIASPFGYEIYCLLELLMTKTGLVFRLGNCESCLLQVNLIKGPVTCFGIF